MNKERPKTSKRVLLVKKKVDFKIVQKLSSRMDKKIKFSLEGSEDDFDELDESPFPIPCP